MAAVRLGTVAPLVLSGLIGIFLGDLLLFTAVGRLGPRRAGVLFALNAPIAALLGWLVLGETLNAVAVAGDRADRRRAGARDPLRPGERAGGTPGRW